MNLTGKREVLQKFYLPLAYLLFWLQAPPNIITLTSFILGTASALAYYYDHLLSAFFLLLFSGLFDLADGAVARLSGRQTKFGAVFDWIADKWVDGLVLGTVGYFYAGPVWATFSVTLSLLHSFIKPVAYAEIGYQNRSKGKILDPLEGIGFFGRPETHFTLLMFTLFEKANLPFGLSAGIKIITLLTAISLLQRILYLYKNYGKVEDE
ncbi:MAG: CDP-alcohol phosphatidyltransferase family protein [Caldimicrobium sp.]